MDLTDKKILITGAAGSLGKQLCYQFNQMGIKPIAHVRESSNTAYIDSLNLEKRITDLRDLNALEKLLEGIDGVIHTAAWVNFRRDKLTQFTGINTFGASDLYKAARRVGVKRFLHVSTVGAIGAMPRKSTNGNLKDISWVTEESEYNLGKLKIPYFMTKRAAEEELFRLSAEGGPELVVVNPTIIVAPSRSGDDRSLARKYFRWLIIPEYHNIVNLVDIRDLVPGIICALAKGRAGERYILGGENISLKDLALTVSAIIKKAPHLVHFPRPAVDFVARMAVVFNKMCGRGKISFYPDLVKMLDYDWAYTSRKARLELGYKIRSIYTTLEDLLSNDFVGTWLKPKAVV